MASRIIRSTGLRRAATLSQAKASPTDWRWVECPRDAMQGLKDFVPTEEKIKFINQLLKVGYHTVDFGSFVNPKAVPQMADTADVLKHLDQSPSHLLAIVANERGAHAALEHSRIKYLGFPMSVSETFQQRNTNQSIARGLEVLKAINGITNQAPNRECVTYLSMAFGNPYGDATAVKDVAAMALKVADLGITTISLADTVGAADCSLIRQTFDATKTALDTAGYKNIELGVHLHTTASTAVSKVEAAFDAGCRRFDVAIGGMGGCPFAKEGGELTGNTPTEALRDFTRTLKRTADGTYEKTDGEGTVTLADVGINEVEFAKAVEMQRSIFANRK